jgi:hypothetical protein
VKPVLSEKPGVATLVVKTDRDGIADGDGCGKIWASGWEKVHGDRRECPGAKDGVALVLDAVVAPWIAAVAGERMGKSSPQGSTFSYSRTMSSSMLSNSAAEECHGVISPSEALSLVSGPSAWSFSVESAGAQVSLWCEWSVILAVDAQTALAFWI